MFLNHTRKRDWNKHLGEYQAAVLDYLDSRPACFPTLQAFRPRSESDRRVVNLLVLERRRTRRVHYLLDKLADAVEAGRLKEADVIDIQVSDTIMEIIDIWLKLNKRFR